MSDANNDRQVDASGPWNDRKRSPVAAAMLNPCFVAVLLAATARGYRQEAGDGMPWALSFVSAPLVLHRGSRAALPNRISTHVATWLAREPAIHAAFPARAAALVEPVKAGLRFGVRHEILELRSARLVGLTAEPASAPASLREIARQSTFVGRWLTRLDQPSTAFALFGVTV